jgi:hypothetical protein
LFIHLKTIFKSDSFTAKKYNRKTGNKKIADVHKTTEVLTCLTLESRNKVDEMVDNALKKAELKQGWYRIMMKLKANGLKWLKALHLLAVACWVGGGVSLILLYFIKPGLNDAGTLYGINRSIHHVDIAVVVIPGAFGCFITGLVYSIFSNWGFFRHNWIIYKWIVTIVAILFGTFFLGPWETQMMEISGKIGLSSLTDKSYLYNEKMNLIFGSIQVAVLIITIFISIFRPWKKSKQDNKT